MWVDHGSCITCSDGQLYHVTHDGGVLGRAGRGHGYGSYLLECPDDGWDELARLDLGHSVTVNVAEYEALIAGLARLLEAIGQVGRDPATCRVETWGDSRLVVRQVMGTWRTHAAHLVPLRDQARLLLGAFGYVVVNWVPRRDIVVILGH